MNNLPKILITDVDGVFTSGKFTYTADGKVSKEFGPHDSDGIKIIRSLGIEVIAISADKRGFSITEKRMSDMGVELFLVSESDRFSYIQDRYSHENIIFVGDGIFDAASLRHAKLSFAPANAPEFVKEYANVVLSVSGGSGVFLEIALYLLRSSENAEQNISNFLKKINLK